MNVVELFSGSGILSTEFERAGHKTFTNGGDMWEKSNLRLLCHGCHVKKTKVDMMKKRYVKEGQRLLGVGCS